MATNGKDSKPNKVYFKREEYSELLGDDFVKEFDAAREAHKERFNKLSEMAAECIAAPDGYTIKLTPGLGDTLGVAFVEATGGDSKASTAGAADKLAAAGAKLYGPDKEPKGNGGKRKSA